MSQRGRAGRQRPALPATRPGDTPNQSPTTRVTAVRAEYHEGPLPPPATLEEYNQIIPNAAERIFVLLEKQANHRMNLEDRVITAETKRANRGLICATGVCVLGFGVSIALALVGSPVTAGVLSGGVLASVVATFIYGTNSRRSERQERVKQLREKVPDNRRAQ